ncbi:hypothetical protein T07_695 [Trichinella nelsoni]|uniref:Uncharacterized protein n=1 Tax=Trichinella nelsoni TaxID=6336 RepID=A0A0V0RYC2_9BILA|nr:hypothetical protein T07_695 [Trichinella nelsoni]
MYFSIGNVEKKLCTVALHPVIAGVRLGIQGRKYYFLHPNAECFKPLTPLVFVWKDFLTLTVNYVIVTKNLAPGVA